MRSTPSTSLPAAPKATHLRFASGLQSVLVDAQHDAQAPLPAAARVWQAAAAHHRTARPCQLQGRAWAVKQGNSRRRGCAGVGQQQAALLMGQLVGLVVFIPQADLVGDQVAGRQLNHHTGVPSIWRQHKGPVLALRLLAGG